MATLSAIRRRWRLKTVSGRLTFWYVCTLAVSLGAFAAFVLVMRAQSLRSELDLSLGVRFSAAGAELAAVLAKPGAPDTIHDHIGLAELPMLLRWLDGVEMYRSSTFPDLADADAERLNHTTAEGQMNFLTALDDRGQEVRIAYRIVPVDDGTKCAMYLAVPTAPLTSSLRDLAIVQALGILLVLTVARYGSAFTARRALAPIDEIIRRGRDITGAHPGTRLAVATDTVEIEQLVVTLNRMLERLEEPVQTAQRFAANVSHELQTPITAMRIAVESLLRAERPPDNYREIAADVLLDLERLSALIRDLRLLAVAGAGKLVTPQETFDLGAVVAECCEIARAIGEEKHIHVEQHIQPGLMVTGSALHLRRAVLNLTDNALRYSSPGGTITVKVSSARGAARVEVTDSGCGIAAADLSRIFEPFFRTDPARARETGGSGLGLAIADQVVKAHGGRIEVSSVQNTGSTFTIHLPARMAAPAA